VHLDEAADQGWAAAFERTLSEGLPSGQGRGAVGERGLVQGAEIVLEGLVYDEDSARRVARLLQRAMAQANGEPGGGAPRDVEEPSTAEHGRHRREPAGHEVTRDETPGLAAAFNAELLQG
jgi:hypothetical protein